jgi:hypothetical protein
MQGAPISKQCAGCKVTSQELCGEHCVACIKKYPSTKRVEEPEKQFTCNNCNLVVPSSRKTLDDDDSGSDSARGYCDVCWPHATEEELAVQRREYEAILQKERQQS